MSMKIEMHGLKALSRTIDALPEALRSAAERAVLRAGAVPIRKAAKSHASKSKDSGLLEKSIGLTVRKNKGLMSARIGPRKGMRKKVTRTDKRTGNTYEEIADPNNYSHLVEFGTSHSAAKPFIRPAIDQSAGQVVSAMAAGLDKHLTRVAARLRKTR